MLNKIIIALLFLISAKIAAQDSLWLSKPDVQISGFLDVFYAYDFGRPSTDTRQPFLYNHSRHNEFNLNLGFIKLGVNHAKYRAGLALQAGTYPNDNYAAEQGLLKNIFEANLGISLTKKNTLWLDAGIFASHLGSESAISMDNWTLTRSLLAESSPYYLSGVKLTANPNSKLMISALICNGWQRIQRVKGSSLPSFGTQIYYAAHDNVKLNWSTFIGTDDPDSTRRMRYFNNFYSQIQCTKKLSMMLGFDLGIQQQSKNSGNYHTWFGPLLIFQYAFDKKWAIALRGEYYQDPNGVIIPTGTLNGFQTVGSSLNIDYKPHANIACRLEGRWFNSLDDIFQQGSNFVSNNFFIAVSTAIKFDYSFKK